MCVGGIERPANTSSTNFESNPMSYAWTMKSAAIAMALAATVPMTTSIAHAKTCKSYSVSKSGGKKWTNLSARLSSRTEWRRHVRGKISWTWSVYAMAKNKGYNCKRKGLKWRCTAYGRPCKA